MIVLETLNGIPVDVPENAAEDISPHFRRHQADRIAAYYKTNGYVVVSGLIPEPDTTQARRKWDSDIKPFRGKIYRQASARLERHRFNERGWVMNPILNPQSLDPRRFGGFRDHVRHNVLASTGLQQVLADLLGDRPKIVQSMYFEGNSSTWEHRDSLYLDSEHIGSMVGAWIALEDIAPRAGRFFVVPGSHRYDRGAADSVAAAHDSHVRSTIRRMRENGVQVRAPALREGDVLFWNALTIHGSLDSHDPERSRSSITCRAIPARHRLMQYRTRVLDVAVEDTHGTLIHTPKDMARLANRTIRAIESLAPGPFYALKRAAIRALVR